MVFLGDVENLRIINPSRATTCVIALPGKRGE